MLPPYRRISIEPPIYNCDAPPPGAPRYAYEKRAKRSWWQTSLLKFMAWAGETTQDRSPLSLRPYSYSNCPTKFFYTNLIVKNSFDSRQLVIVFIYIIPPIQISRISRPYALNTFFKMSSRFSDDELSNALLLDNDGRGWFQRKSCRNEYNQI